MPRDTSVRDFIEIVGARENNLRDVTLDIPKHTITVLTGVSGSGKSSLAFDTIAAESQRQLNDTFTTFVRNRLPRYGQPDADAIENLSPAIIVDQKRLGGNARSTVGTITDIYSMMRLLYSRLAEPFVGFSSVFSFNLPEGMCPTCEGIGRTVELDVDAMFDKERSINDGGILLPGFGIGKLYWKLYVHSGLFDNDKPLGKFTKAEWKTLLHGTDDPVDMPTRGIIDKYSRVFGRQDVESLSPSQQGLMRRFVTTAVCPDCDGARLNERALSATVAGRNIAEMTAMEASDLLDLMRTVDDRKVARVVAGIVAGLEHLVHIGLGYLSLDRETTTLSGGESQRVKMVRHLGNTLTDMLYVFDEPSIGMHPRDVGRLNTLLVELRQAGNTVLVVEHDRDVIDIADHVVDMGPGAGSAGGTVVYQGDLDGLRRGDTPTGVHLRTRLDLKDTTREPTGWLRVEGANRHNLKDVTVDFPTGVLTVVTGVAGSGKSTLVDDVLARQEPDAVVVDQSSLQKSSRSTPATATGMMDEVRRLFARANDVDAALFSFNSKGACPHCQGHGVVYTDLAFLDPMKTVCEECDGRRFTEEVLAHRLGDKSIGDVLESSAADLLGWFEALEVEGTADERARRKVVARLRAMNDVGLGYLTLGQPLSTLSGGENQRLKLAGELKATGGLYLIDEPTIGMHMADVQVLVGVLDRLVDAGNTVIVVEHDLDVVKRADWVVDMGPDGGKRGGEVVYAGPPAGLVQDERSITAQHLRASLAA
jgi:excinuclease ABC A subunit